VLAPLVGGSDLAFRLLCRKYGAEVTFTEMIQASYFNNVDMVKKSGSTQVDFHESDRPLILQVAANVDEADEVIKMVNNPIFAGHIDGVDLNCGCPQGFAMKRGIGAALFRFPDQYVELVRKIAAGIPYPLSVKCRMHEDGVESTIELLRRVVDAGAVAITLHGRNWTQRGQNRGKTDYEGVVGVFASVLLLLSTCSSGMCAVRKGLPESLAFVANGDIQEFDDFERVMKLTGARAGMSGYGALLDPGGSSCLVFCYWLLNVLF
jgi:tRNA-dihydrouridine synthase